MTEIINVRMYEDTIKQVDNLQKTVKAPSRSDAIRRAIEITTVFINAIEHGDKVIIENKKGKQRQILITGINK